MRKANKSLTLIASLSIATLVVSGCASPGYERVCSWCDDASQAQLRKDVVECNAIATSQVPERSVRRKTGRIVTTHGSTSCSTSKKGNTTCSTGSTYTYPEEETVEVTDYDKRKSIFTECTDLKARSYRPKATDKTSAASIENEKHRNTTQEKPLIGKTADEEICKTLFQGWVFVNLLEKVCGFNRGIAKEVGIYSKTTCPLLTDDQRKQWAMDPMITIKTDVEKLGGSEFCRRKKSVYEGFGK